MLRRLQRTAGNDAVAGIVCPGSRCRVPRVQLLIDGMPFPKVQSEQELVDNAAASLDKGDIKKIHDWKLPTYAQKMQFIDVLNGGWTGPMDEYALEAIWGSFGDGMIKVAEDNPARWAASLDGGAELYKLGAAKSIADKFLVDVGTVANGNLDKNDTYCKDELKRLGEGEPGGAQPAQGPAGGGGAANQQTPEQRLAELQGAARLMKDARRAQGQLGYQIVGLRKNENPPPQPGETLPGGIWEPYVRVLFDASQPPSDAEQHPDAGLFPPGADLPPVLPYQGVKDEWDELQAFQEGLTIAYPAIGVAAGSGADNLDIAAGDDPKAAKGLIVGQLNAVRDNIAATRPRMGKLVYELKPIHDILFSGGAMPSGIDWSKPVAKSLAHELVQLHEDREFWVTMGLSTAAAALFILAEFATAGTATAVLVGAGVGIGAGQAAASWEKAIQLSTAAKASPVGLDPLVTSGQADMAMFEAVLNTLMVAVDVLTSVKPLVRAASGGVVKEALGAGKAAERAATSGLETLAKAEVKALPAGSRELVERSLAELGAEQVCRQTKKTPAELMEIVGKDSPYYARLKAFAEMDQNLLKLAPAEFAQRASNLEAEITKDAVVGQQLASLAVERLGPKTVIEHNGGWAKLSLILGNESQAGKSIMAWRDGIMGDIENFVKTLPAGVDDAGQAAVKRTGSQGKFTNDFDVSLLGANASQNRNALRSFVAGRLGTTPDRLKFLALADFFTDPRRLHLYDQLDPALRAVMASRAEKVAEGTIFARMLYDADKAGNTELAKQIRSMMSSLKVEEVAYKELGAADIGQLYKDIDELHASLEAALKGGDKGQQAKLVEKIGDTQGLINAAEGGGYFSGGATAMLVSMKEGIASGTKLLPEQTYTALLDQLPKLYGEANSLLRTGFVGTAEAVEAIKGIGKYSKRFRDLMKDMGVTVADEGVWNALATRCEKILKQAKGEASVTTLDRLTQDAEAVRSEVNGLLAEFNAQAPSVLATLSKQAGLSGKSVDLAAIQFLVRAQAKLGRASSAVKDAMNQITVELARMSAAAAKHEGGGGTKPAEP